MRRLKIPGRIIGRESSFHAQYYLQQKIDSAHPMMDIEATDKHPAVSKWVRLANTVRTHYNSPWKYDQRLQTEPTGEQDIDGRGRDGLLIRPPELDHKYVLKVALLYVLLYGVGIDGAGRETHVKRFFPWGRGFWGNN